MVKTDPQTLDSFAFSEAERIAIQLEAIAHWHQDQVFNQTSSGQLLLSAAAWVRKAATLKRELDETVKSLKGANDQLEEMHSTRELLR